MNSSILPLTRRRFIGGAAALLALSFLPRPLRAAFATPERAPVLSGTEFQLDIGPVPMSGSSTTVKQTTLRLAPSMRMNADLADWDRSLLNIVTGQSGQILSTHYRDQWPDYYNARSYPMQFRTVQAKSRLEFKPR